MDEHGQSTVTAPVWRCYTEGISWALLRLPIGGAFE
jgi:hypothetical protein